MQKNSEKRFEKLTGRKMSGQEWKDAWLENQAAERYSKVGVSPIYSNGNFSRNTKEIDEKLGNRLTEDDKVSSTSKKRNKSQY